MKITIKRNILLQCVFCFYLGVFSHMIFNYKQMTFIKAISQIVGATWIILIIMLIIMFIIFKVEEYIWNNDTCKKCQTRWHKYSKESNTFHCKCRSFSPMFTWKGHEWRNHGNR